MLPLRRMLPILFCLALLPGFPAKAAELTASLDRTRLGLGESLWLTLTAPGHSWGTPDWSALEEDFAVDSQGQSTKMTWINGQASSTREWRLRLVPRRTGRLTIPPLKIGDLESAPLSVEVLPAALAGRQGEAPPVLVEVEVDKTRPYVQEQVLYTVRVLRRQPMSQATLEDPRADGLLVERLGEDRPGEVYRDGQHYQVVERRYAVFPQRRGPLRITPPVLSGTLVETRPGRPGGSRGSRAFEHFFGQDPFGGLDSLLGRTRSIQVRGPELELEVQPPPAAAGSPWLPAKSLELTETWAPDPPVWRVGEPVTRTLVLTARGLSAAQLPEDLAEVPSGIHQYPDKARTETQVQDNDLVAVKELKQALVPTSEGEWILPEVRLAWWDSVTDQPRVARLPAHPLRVLPARGGAIATAPPARQPSPALASTETPEIPSQPVKQALPGDRMPATPSSSETPGFWPWISLVLGLGWCATLWLWWRRRPLPATPSTHRPPAVPDLSAIRRACHAQDPGGVRAALLAWAAARWPRDPPRLETLARRLEEPAAETLRALDRRLYASEIQDWDGQAAWASLQPALEKARRRPARDPRQTADPLPPLYPRLLTQDREDRGPVQA